MNYGEVTWGLTLCDDCRIHSAEGLYEGEPVCLDCADRRLERYAAITMNAAMRELLPPLLDRWTGKDYV